MEITPDVFREVMRRWPSGVAVVTSLSGSPPSGGAHGMVVGSFCSLSAEPPLVMFSASATSRTHAVVAESGVFAISILSQEQVEVFERFAGFAPAHEANRFAGLATMPATTGVPVFPDALAWLDCRVVRQHPGEGYTIFVGEVLEAALGSAAEALPLVYFRRRRHHLREAS